MSQLTESIARESRRSVIKMTSAAKAAHTGSSLSLVDILAVLYGEKVPVGARDEPDRSVVLISKGHAAAGVYAVMAHAGYFDVSMLDDYCLDGGRLGGHVTRGSVPGVEFSTGSLGHALPFGVGKALASKRLKNNARVFVVLSDGELDEGSNWEAILLASHLKLDNLTVLIDRNGLQSLARTEDTVALEPLTDKWESFGWSVNKVNGHDHTLLSRAIDSATEVVGKPSVIVCATVKGFGVSFMENSVLWHYKPPQGLEFEQAMTELGG